MGRPGVRSPAPGPRRRAVALAGALILAVACEGGPVPVEPGFPEVPSPEPRIGSGAVAPIPANVLGAMVTGRTRFADSAAVRYGLAGSPLDSLTPAQPYAGDSAAIPVLGLLPDTTYAFEIVAYGRGGTATSASLTLRTGPLPPDLPQYTATGPDPSPGYVVFSAGKYGIVIDNTGRVVWYRRFDYGPGLSFEAQPNGHYVARPGTAEPTDPHPWVQIDPLGNVMRVLDCARGLEPRLHDLLAELDGSYWIMCDDIRSMDLSGLGGVADAQVAATAVQHVGADGVLLFSWTPFDHFDITDIPPAARSGTSVNWTHGNALDLDVDGNVVVSFRNLNEITKIDVQTGEVIWRLGGARNQFTFAESDPAFARQHGLRLPQPNQLMLLDNLGDSLDSRVESYTYDAEQRTVSLLGSHGATPPVTAQLGGSVQPLPSGRTLVSFGTAGRVEEYDTSGNVVWRIEGGAGYIFRAQRIRSLYRPGVGTSR